MGNVYEEIEKNMKQLPNLPISGTINEIKQQIGMNLDAEELSHEMSQECVSDVYNIEKDIRKVFQKEMRIQSIKDMDKIKLHGMGSLFSFCRMLLRLNAAGNKKDVTSFIAACIDYHKQTEEKRESSDDNIIDSIEDFKTEMEVLVRNQLNEALETAIKENLEFIRKDVKRLSIENKNFLDFDANCLMEDIIPVRSSSGFLGILPIVRLTEILIKKEGDGEEVSEDATMKILGKLASLVILDNINIEIGYDRKHLFIPAVPVEEL
jgi:soluble cytochrome b562